MQPLILKNIVVGSNEHQYTASSTLALLLQTDQRQLPAYYTLKVRALSIRALYIGLIHIQAANKAVCVTCCVVTPSHPSASLLRIHSIARVKIVNDVCTHAELMVA